MKEMYDEVEISYNENRNMWEFELAGKIHSLASLKECKEKIDKKPVEKRKTEFFKAFYIGNIGYGNSDKAIKEVKCGAYKKGYYNGYDIWVMQGTERRSMSTIYLYADTEENKALFERYNTLVLVEKRNIEKQISELRNSFELIPQKPKEENL